MNGRIKAPALAALAMLLAPSADVFAAEEPAATEEEEMFGDWDAPVERERIIKEGSVSLGLMLVDDTGNSSKLEEYRDFGSGLFIDRLLYSFDDTQTGRFLDIRGNRLGRDDADLLVEFGSFGPPEREQTRGWSVDASWNRTPHRLSNSARTPYEYLGNGQYQVARSIVDAIQISTLEDARSWTLPDAGPGRAGEDARIARALGDAVRHVDLGTQRDTGEVGYSMLFSEFTKARVEFKRDIRDGSVISGAGIGDRPPRSVNVQLPEPIDQQTYDFTLAFEHVGSSYHMDASYLFSNFENDIAALTWNSLFHAPGYFTPGATDYDGVRRPGTTLYATNGAIALAPDNKAQQLVFNVGANLPLRSSLSASVMLGKMEQDEALLPYATTDFGGRQTPGALPRDSAEAEIDTAMFNVVYAMNPVSRLNLKFHYRYYDLDNRTDRAAWLGNAADTSSRPIFSQRYNIGYDLEQQNLGADASYYFGKAGTLAFTLARERKERPQREVQQTDEDIYRLTYRVRPGSRTTLTAKLGRSSLDGTPYNGEIVDQTYAYDPLLVPNDPNNPLAAFGDHPGLRRFDVTDRERDEFDLSLAYAATERLNASFSYRDRSSDYDSEMVSVINTWDPIRAAFVDAAVDPTQLGLLNDGSRQLSLDFSYLANEGLSLNAFASIESLELEQRGRYLDENNRLFSATNRIANGTMDWQDTSGQYIWDAAIDDRTKTFGVGLDYAPAEAGYEFSAGYTHSRGKVEIDYVAGARIIENDTTSVNNYAEWTSPPNASFKTNSLTMSWRRQFAAHWAVGLRYLFEIYRVTDWQQEGTAGHQQVLNPWFVADRDPETAGTSQDRAGSRLVRLGDLLAPSYDAHVGLVTVEYRW